MCGDTFSCAELRGITAGAVNEETQPVCSDQGLSINVTQSITELHRGHVLPP